jgi:general secretion pathway protein I
VNGERGFTLLEVLVASVVMAIAVAGVLSALSTSMRNQARLTDYDRSAMLARRKMDELLSERKVPKFVVLEGQWDPVLTNNRQSGWRARVQPWEMLPNSGPGSPVVDRIELEVWWMDGERRRTFTLEGFRRGQLTESDIASGALLPK